MNFAMSRRLSLRFRYPSAISEFDGLLYQEDCRNAPAADDILH